MLGESKLRQVLLGGEAADPEEMAAGLDAWSAYLYAIDFNALHPLYAVLMFNAAFLGPDMVRNWDKIANLVTGKKPAYRDPIMRPVAVPPPAEKEIKGERLG